MNYLNKNINKNLNNKINTIKYDVHLNILYFNKIKLQLIMIKITKK